MGNTSSHETDYSLSTFSDGRKYYAAFNKTPFAEGSCRYAFKGTYRGSGSRAGERCVVKAFKHQYSDRLSNWKPDLKAHLKAEEMAIAFNANVRSSKPISFLQPAIARVTDLAEYKLLGVIPIPFGTYNNHLARKEFVSLEDCIPGKWEKYNSNGGYVRGNSDLIQAFSHYSYAASGGKVLVCDLQGVQTYIGYTLTDPAVCSRSQEFGLTDTGAFGIGLFFQNHRCTSFCQDFLLPGVNTSTRDTVHFHSKRSTSYTFDLTFDQKRVNKIYRDRDDIPAIKE